MSIRVGKKAELAFASDAALNALVKEMKRARRKFPGNALLVVALAEEVGELARELLQNGNTAHARKEAIQVACVAMRIATEGDATFNNLTAEQRQK